MRKITDEQLKNMNVEERLQLRRKCAEEGDIESLLIIAKYHFVHGCAATNESNIPEMFYYYGRLHRLEELQDFLKDKNLYFSMLPQSCLELAQNLLQIGYRFPQLNEEEISYLERKYSDSKTFELFDIIMFDSHLLPRQIEKFDKDSLNRKNTEFSKEFLIKTFSLFLANEELDHGYDELYVYSRIENKIIQKKYDNIGLGEYVIVDPIPSNEFWILINENYGQNSADSIIKQLCDNSGWDWEELRDSDFFSLNPEDIDEVIKDNFNDSNIVDDIKAKVALNWLNKVNSEQFDLI